MGYNVVECSVERCVHNMNNMCNAQHIHVVGDNTKQASQTDCHTFELRQVRSSVVDMTNVNITGAVDQIFSDEPVMNPAIRCSVGECIYNVDLRACRAEQINVEGPDSGTIQQTECATFRKS